jgi:hypothetical protein
MGVSEAWFAGLIDGEGCFTITIGPQHKHILKFSLMFIISMKEGDWVGPVSAILSSNDIPFHSRRRKNQLEITINSQKSVKKMIGLVLPYLVVKRPLAEKLLTLPAAPPRNRFTEIDAPYLKTVCGIVDYVRVLNRGKNRRHKWNSGSILSFYDICD